MTRILTPTSSRCISSGRVKGNPATQHNTTQRNHKRQQKPPAGGYDRHTCTTSKPAVGTNSDSKFGQWGRRLILSSVATRGRRVLRWSYRVDHAGLSGYYMQSFYFYFLHFEDVLQHTTYKNALICLAFQSPVYLHCVYSMNEPMYTCCVTVDANQRSL